MKQTTGKGRRAWFWVGVVLLSISALWWLLIVLIIVDEPGEAATFVGVGLLVSAVPIGVGVYCVRRSRKAPAVQMQQSPKPAYVSQPAVTPTQDSQHMVIAFTGQRLLWICVFMVAVSLAFFYHPVAIVISVFLGLYSLGKIFGTKFVVDKLTQTVGIHERRFLLIHRQRVIPFRDITSVDIDCKKKWGLWGAQALVRRSAWQVSLNVADEKVKIDHTTNKADMYNLASRVSNFMGKELVDNSEIPGIALPPFLL